MIEFHPLVASSDGPSGAVSVVRYREDLMQQGGGGEGVVDFRHTFSAAEWATIIAIDTGDDSIHLQIPEPLPFPQQLDTTLYPNAKPQK